MAITTNITPSSRRSVTAFGQRPEHIVEIQLNLRCIATNDITGNVQVLVDGASAEDVRIGQWIGDDHNRAGP